MYEMKSKIYCNSDLHAQYCFILFFNFHIPYSTMLSLYEPTGSVQLHIMLGALQPNIVVQLFCQVYTQTNLSSLQLT